MFNKNRFLGTLMIVGFLATPTLFLGGAGGCGGGSSSSDSSSGGSGTGTGTASTASLSTTPSTDLSALDFSQSSSGSTSLSALSALAMKDATSSSDKKGLGHNLNEVGNPSRAGCEANSQKQEIFRHAVDAQLPRCYMEAMATANIFAIPTDGTYLHAHIKPPADLDDNRDKACDNIPKEREKERAACKAGEGQGGPGKDGIKARAGVISGVLQLDLCEGKDGQTESANYSASGSKYTLNATRKRTHPNFEGKNVEEHASITTTIDLATTGSVAKSAVTLGAAGSATATASMKGHFGSGTLNFEAIGSDSSNRVSGVFNGEFTDPRSTGKSNFTGKLVSRFGGSTKTGTAKFSYTGKPPPFKVSDMIPFDLPEAQIANFLKSFGGELGIELTTSNYKDKVLCPNANFDPGKDIDDQGTSAAKPKPMVLGDLTTGCSSVTHTGVESFSIANGTKKGNFTSLISQVFTRIADAGSPYFDEINSSDLSKLTEKTTDAFPQVWDCTAGTGTFTEFDFAKFTPAQISALEPEIKACLALEEKLHGNEGMGGNDCNQKQQQGDVNNFAKEGPPTQGKFGGDLVFATGGTCSQSNVPQHLFFNTNDSSSDKYCLPLDGSCAEFTVANKSASNLGISLPASTDKIDAMTYTQSGTDPATDVTITFKSAEGATCTGKYNLSQTTFDKPPEFDPNAGRQDPTAAGAKQPGQQGFVPKSCIDAGLTTEAACRAHCEETRDCRG